MGGREFSGDKYRFGFNGKEKEPQINGANEMDYSFEFRVFNSRLGKFLSVDPRQTEYPWQSSFAYYGNCPVSLVDFLGLGDYYTKDGQKLGSDGKTVADKNGKQVPDDKAYVTTKAAFDANTSKTITNWDKVLANKDTKELSVTNSSLNQFANVVAQESSGDKVESFAIASAICNLKKEMGTSDLQSTYTKGKIYGYNNNQNGSNYMNNAEFSMGAAINALSGGFDYSNGAIRWDGFDFAQKGFDHVKAKTAGLNIDAQHLKTFLSHYGYNPTNPATAGIHLATSGSNKGMVLYKSVAAHGATIFWGKNDKTFNYPGKIQINGKMSEDGPCIKIDHIYPNRNFKGSW